MKTLVGLLLIVFVMVACNEQTSTTYEFKWAKVDIRTIENELYKKVQQQNPYKPPYDISKNELRKKIRDLSSQISSLRSAAREQCLKKEAKKEGYKGSRYDNLCVSQISRDPKIMELSQQKDELEAIRTMQNNHDNDLREFTKTKTQKALEEYSRDKFELVIRTDRNTVLYTKQGMSLDITEAVMRIVNSQSMNMEISSE